MLLLILENDSADTVLSEELILLSPRALVGRADVKNGGTFQK